MRKMNPTDTNIEKNKSISLVSDCVLTYLIAKSDLTTEKTTQNSRFKIEIIPINQNIKLLIRKYLIF